jgi:hypothetical protein
MSSDNRAQDFLDVNGREVHSFASRMANLGFAQLTDLLIAMFTSGSWRHFQDGLGTYQFLPGEFDYFLTQQGVSRDDVMNGVRDVETKAKLEAAMDERRTGEPGYRRRIAEIRTANPQRPGRPILPFGYPQSEANYLFSEGTLPKSGPRPPLGSAVRRWVRTGGVTTRAPSQQRTPLERARHLALRLNDDALAELVTALKQEQRRRQRRATAEPPLSLNHGGEN